MRVFNASRQPRYQSIDKRQRCCGLGLRRDVGGGRRAAGDDRGSAAALGAALALMSGPFASLAAAATCTAITGARTALLKRTGHRLIDRHSVLALSFVVRGR